MEVILTKEVLGLGDPGEIVDVARGYARNYLLPQGMALEATKTNVAGLESQRKRIQAQQAKDADLVRAEAKTLEGLSLTIIARAGESGKLYGSVTNLQIAETMASLGHEVDRRRILLDQPLKSLGTFPIKIKLHPQVVVEIEVKVEPEQKEEPALEARPREVEAKATDAEAAETAEAVEADQEV
ncbi:MAG: 50S ribosomal protein L9 [Deltaproteobacteria bacterium]|nr:50S ribosomal protein L9 [Deltaproteobacteria bacterium]